MSLSRVDTVIPARARPHDASHFPSIECVNKNTPSAPEYEATVAWENVG